MLTEIFTKNLEIVFFIYGLAFFTMGVVIFAKPRTESIFKLAGIIWILAAFGVIHGLREWCRALVIEEHGPVWDSAQLITLFASYVLFFEFGRRFIVLSFSRFLNKWFTIVMSSLALALIPVSIFALKENPDICIRYFLGFPGGVMAGLGFILYYRGNEPILKLFNVRVYFLAAAVSMGVYGILGGIVVPKADFFPASFVNKDSFLDLFGIPVQVFRAICAVFLTWSVWNILGIFDREARANLINKTEQAVTARAYTENIIDAMTCALTVVGPDGKINAVNAAACELLGYNEKELIGKREQEIFAEKPVFDNKKLKNFPVTYLSKDKVKIPALFSRSFMNDKRGEITDTVYVGKDMREMKEMQEKVIASEKLAAMGKVASIIGHEFRNQLGIIGISVYFLKTKLRDGDEKVKQHLGILERQVMETNMLVENILAYSRSGEMERKSIDAGNVLSAAIDKVPNTDKIAIAVKIENGLPRVDGDAIRLSQVFVNLITNALQAIGEKEGRLTISAASAGGFLEITFEDTGPGIREEDRSKLFTPFFSTKSRGVGLGLAFCKNVIELHNGAIDIKGGPVKGTIVTVRLPTKG